jgi:predicted nucleotidyltransferase
MTQRELAARAGTSQPAIARYESGRATPSIRTLERLLEACGSGLVLEPKVGTTKQSARGILGPRARQLARRRSALLDLFDREGARKPRVFGSVARGEDTADSDIDLAVELPADASLVDLARLRRKVTDLLGVPVDLVTPDLLKPVVRERMEAEARAL